MDYYQRTCAPPANANASSEPNARAILLASFMVPSFPHSVRAFRNARSFHQAGNGAVIER